jgi:predicted dehydrogenase
MHFSGTLSDMNNKPVVPVVVGRGMAGQAILKSLAIVSQSDPDLNLLPVRMIPRGSPPVSGQSAQAENVLFIANPSGLHAQYILEGANSKFSVIAADKPVCVRPEEISLLGNIQIPVTVFHGYRAMWGTRTIKSMIESGALGDVFSFESRYWQSSSAQTAIAGSVEKRIWKNSPQLNGPLDVLTDLGSHVVDICLHLMAEKPAESKCWMSYQNSAAPHRDTHVHLILKFSGDRRAIASISKTMHGATNNFEYTVVGTKAAATWRFLQPDEIEFGSGNQTSIIRRQDPNESSGSLPFHGLGWLEGYVEITRQTLRLAAGLNTLPVPTLQESLAVMDVLLHAC